MIINPSYEELKNVLETIMTTAKLLGYKTSTHIEKSDKRTIYQYEYENESAKINIRLYNINQMKISENEWVICVPRKRSCQDQIKILQILLEKL